MCFLSEIGLKNSTSRIFHKKAFIYLIDTKFKMLRIIEFFQLHRVLHAVQAYFP